MGIASKERLSARQRAIVGLWQMGVRDANEMSRAIFKTGPTPLRTWRLIREIRALGERICFPMEYGQTGSLSCPIRCPRCGSLVSAVPCVACCSVTGWGFPSKEEHPLPPHPTNASPGSEEKIEVMRDRVEAGYQPCHPLDKRRYPKPPRVTLPTISEHDIESAAREDIEDASVQP